MAPSTAARSRRHIQLTIQVARLAVDGSQRARSHCDCAHGIRLSVAETAARASGGSTAAAPALPGTASRSPPRLHCASPQEGQPG